MKKLLYSLVFLLSSFVLLTGSAFAQDSEPGSSGISVPEDKMIAFPRPDGPVSPFLGQSHFYSYVFRGNGEAVVTAKIVLANTSESGSLKETTLRFPNINPTDIVVYQIIGTGQCIRYDTPGFDQGRGGYYPPTCLEYGEPDYYGYYGEAKYQKAEFDFKGDTLTVKLPSEIKAQKSGAFFVYFRSFGIAQKKSFGSFSYIIETLKVDDQVNQLTVGINTDSDLFLKGVKGQVDYRDVQTDMASLKAAPNAGEASSSPAIDRFIGSVGYGTITKSASNLAPLESYSVTGAYSKTKFGLYAKEAMIGLGIFVLILIVAIFAIRKVLGSRNTDHGSLFFVTLGLSFLSSTVMGIYTGGLLFLVTLLNNISYQYQPLIALFLGLISFCVYSFLLFAPGAFWGYKKGMGWGIGLIVMTILWLFIFFGIAIAVLFTFGNGDNGGGYPVPLMMKSALE